MSKVDVVDVWLSGVAYGHSGSEGTRYAYQHSLECFCEFAKVDVAAILSDYDILSEKKFKRKYGLLIKAYIAALSKEDYAPGTIQTRVVAVKSFFKYNDLPLSYIPTGNTRVTYHNQEIVKDEIIDLLGISKPRDRAFYSMMAQSGLRPSTLCKLKVKHLGSGFSSGKSPVKVEVPQELAKGKYGKYFSFIGPETVDHLQRYFATRGQLQRESYVFTSYGTDKPLHPKSISAIFKRAITKLKEKGKLDFEQKEEGKPRTLRLYTLRKYFRKQAGHAGHDYVNFWMGHSLGVDEHYFSRDPEHHRKQYAEKAMPHLRLET